jgi:PAS domain S-box-containing protein
MEDDLRVRAELLDAATDSILVHDLSGRFVYVNEAACRLRGYSREELLCKNIQDLMTPEQAKCLPARIRTLAECGEVRFESVERCRDGSLLSSEVYSKACGRGDRQMIFSIARDISSRKEAEELRRLADERLEMLVEERTLAYAVANDQLERECTERRRAEADRAEREERYRLLFDAGTDGVMVFSATREGELVAFLEVNGVAVERYGYTRNELEQLSPLAIVVDTDHEKVRANVKTLRDREHVVIETTHQTKGGFAFPVEVSLSRFMLGGAPTVLSIARDITERKMLAEMEKKAFEQIEKNITQFAILNDQLRNPLAVIVGLADLDGGPTAEKILYQAKGIDQMITRLDQGWIESEKVREFLEKHYNTKSPG